MVGRTAATRRAIELRSIMEQRKNPYPVGTIGWAEALGRLDTDHVSGRRIDADLAQLNELWDNPRKLKEDLDATGGVWRSRAGVR